MNTCVIFYDASCTLYTLNIRLFDFNNTLTSLSSLNLNLKIPEQPRRRRMGVPIIDHHRARPFFGGRLCKIDA